MSAISMLNPKAEVARAAQALAVNMSGAKVSKPFTIYIFSNYLLQDINGRID